MANKNASFPKSLKKGATIGVVSPGSATKNPDALHKGKKLLEEQGFKVILHPQNELSIGQLAGTDAARAQAIMDMFVDSNIDAIMCARGGNGSIRLLELLDYHVIARNPKPFIGFSDITVLLHAFRNLSGLITYHGPMLATNFSGEQDPRTLQDFLNVLGNAGQEITLDFPEVEVLQAGTAEGILIGGNITMLQNILDTPYGWSGDKAILFIEDVDEVLYRIDRMLRHFHLAGRLKNVTAVLVGEMIDVPDGETAFMREGERPYGHTIKQILQDIFPNIPLGINAPSGHGRYMTTVPIGAQARVILDNKATKLTLLKD